MQRESQLTRPGTPARSRSNKPHGTRSVLRLHKNFYGTLMTPTKTLAPGLTALFLLPLLGACASRQIVKPEVVTVNTPVYVKMPAEYTADVPTPSLPARPLVNSDLSDFVPACRVVVERANWQFKQIRDTEAKAGAQ